MKIYLNKDEILALHDLSLQKFGGASGVREMNSVEAALNRPQNGYYKDIIEEAAALMESLLINHPFVDGNKRTAFVATSVFLSINGFNIQAQSDWLYEKIISWIKCKSNRLEIISRDLKLVIK